MKTEPTQFRDLGLRLGFEYENINSTQTHIFIFIYFKVVISEWLCKIALWSRSRSYSTSGPVSTGMGKALRYIQLPRSAAHPGYHSVCRRNKYTTEGWGV